MTLDERRELEQMQREYYAMEEKVTEQGDAIFDATVLYTPQATGDAWHVRDTRHGNILYYVQQYESMKLVSKGGQDDRA